MVIRIDEVAISGMLERYRSWLEEAEHTRRKQYASAREHFNKIIAEADLMYDGKVGIALEILKKEVIEARKKYESEVLNEVTKN